jgi:hypothetical protein
MIHQFLINTLAAAVGTAVDGRGGSFATVASNSPPDLVKPWEGRPDALQSKGGNGASRIAYIQYRGIRSLTVELYVFQR